MESNARYAQALASIDNELTHIVSHPDRTAEEGSKERNSWELNYLNAIERIAWLIASNRYPKDLVKYYRLDFGWAKGLIEKSSDNSRRKNFEEILEVCKRMGWDIYDPE